ncbi:MAG: hypothetical protein FJ015_01495 [Chloroflexi bacterium]|nr:hypothetical protein [Chloroflexota bacterium]
MSKLIDRLIQTSEAVPPPIGFRAAKTAASSKPRMALIARIEVTESAAPLAGYVASADAVIMAPTGAGKKTIRPSPDTVWGLWPEGKGRQPIKGPAGAGADFVILPLNSAFDLPGMEKLGKILLIEPSLGEGLIRTINELPADAALLAEDEEAAPAITWHRLMLCQRLAELLAKPLLAAVPASVGRDGLKALWKAGVDGVVITVKAGEQVKRLKELRQIVDQTDFPARPRKRVTALLPRIAEESDAAIADDEEEEEEEE